MRLETTSTFLMKDVRGSARGEGSRTFPHSLPSAGALGRGRMQIGRTADAEAKAAMTVADFYVRAPDCGRAA